jgi:hypothetical protein
MPRRLSSAVNLAVGGDLLDVHGRRKFVRGKASRLDDADAFEGREPKFPSLDLAALECFRNPPNREKVATRPSPMQIRPADKICLAHFFPVTDPENFS